MRLTLLLGRACAAALAVSTIAFARQTSPRPQLHVLKDVRLVDLPDAPRVAIVLRDGRIERILEASAQLPLGAREIDGKGMLAVPAFVDAFSQAGCETPTPVAQKDAPRSEASDVQVDMRDANRKGIQPAFRAAEAFNFPKDKSKKWRESGFGALASSPAGQLLAGTSALCTTREAAPRDAIISADLFAHAAFRASGEGYPSTLMGYFAQLRQFFLDVRRHSELQSRYVAGRAGARPPFDAELEAGHALLDERRRVMCEAESAQDIRRWIELGDELGLEVGIVGGREAGRVAELLAARRIPVVLTLDWGDEPKDPHEKDKQAKKEDKPEGEAKPGEKAEEEPPPATDKPPTDQPATDQPPTGDPVAQEAEQPAAKPDEKKSDKDKEAQAKKKWEYEEPLGVREEKRRKWEEGQGSALALHKAGVAFAFGTASSSADELLKKVRTLVEKGLPADAALAALTGNAAQLVGAEGRLGAIQSGADASLALWTAQPTTKDAKCAWLFVDGFSHEFEVKLDAKAEGKPDEGVDATGTWTVELKTDQGTRSGTLVLTMTPEGEVTGTLTSTTPGGGETTTEYKGHVGGKSMTLEGSYTRREIEITSKWKVELAGDTLEGTTTTKGPWGEAEGTVTGSRPPKQAQELEVHEEGCGDEHP